MLPDNAKAIAWDELYKYFGECMDDEVLKIMDSVLEGVQLDIKEWQNETV